MNMVSLKTNPQPREDVLSKVQLREVDLVFDGVSGSTQALRSIDLSIPAGSFTAVVGPSGCGKSTLLKLMSGLIPPTAGRIIVDGKKVVSPLAGVGMAFQNPTLMPWRTLLQNVMLPLEIVEPHASNLKRRRVDYLRDVRDLLASVGLMEFEDHYPWQLSGGMQQRANLCRALVHQPNLLLLDEPFGALDAFTREELWSILQSLWEERHFTAVLITHDLREAVYLADKVYVMTGRPGTIGSSHLIDLARPRTLASTFEPDFVEIAQNLRQDISKAHHS